MPGIEIGDLGRLAGENDCTVGFLRMQQVRVPRRHLLERRQHVTADGVYRRGPPPEAMDAAAQPAADAPAPEAKLVQALKYVTMMKTRIALASTAGGALAKAAIALGVKIIQTPPSIVH